MKKYISIFMLLALLYSTSAVAGQVLDKRAIEIFSAFSNEMDEVEEKYPDVFKKAENFNILEYKEVAEYLRSSSAYPEIKEALNVAKADSLEEMLAIASQVAGSIYAVQMEQVPAGMSFSGLEGVMLQNIETMKQNGVPADIIAEMEADMLVQKTEMENMKKIAENASEADKEFVRKNMRWIMKKMPMEH